MRWNKKGGGLRREIALHLGGKLARFLPGQGKKKVPKVGLGLSMTTGQREGETNKPLSGAIQQK